MEETIPVLLLLHIGPHQASLPPLRPGEGTTPPPRVTASAARQEWEPRAGPRAPRPASFRQVLVFLCLGVN